MPKVKSGKSRTGKNRISKSTTTDGSEHSSTSESMLTPEMEAKMVERITASVVNALRDNIPMGGKELNTDPTYPGSVDSESDTDSDIEEVSNAASDNFSLQVDTTGAISTPISAMVDTKLKQQIWKNKFVDLALLLPQNCVANSRKKGLQFQLVANSTLAVVPNKPKYSIFTIEFWTTAFIRYMAIYAEKFPEAIPHLAKHAEVVRDLASLQNNNAWSVYDQQVRMDRQVRNIPWSTFNMEFYIMATRARDSNNFGGHNQGQRPFRQPLRPYFRGGRQNSRGMGRSVRGADFTRLPRGYCWGFNRDGFCRTPNCKFIHKCSKCGGEHPSVSCSKQPAEKPNFGTKVTTKK